MKSFVWDYDRRKLSSIKKIENLIYDALRESLKIKWGIFLIVLGIGSFLSMYFRIGTSRHMSARMGISYNFAFITLIPVYEMQKKSNLK